MPGIPVTWDYASADIVEWYDELPGCVVLIWLPTNWATQHRTSCIVGSYGGGWISSDHWLNLGGDRTALVAGLSPVLAERFLDSGWAYVHVLWPMGWMTKTLQYQPAMRHPRIQRVMAGVIQHLKTRAAAQRDRDNITGDAAHSLATDSAQYVVNGVSSSSDNWGYAIHQPDGSLPYDPFESPSHRSDFWQRRFNHRVGAAILVDLFSDLRWLDPTLQSANMIPLFGAPDRYNEAPKIGEVSLETLRDASMLPQVELDLPENREIALCTYNIGNGTGDIMGNPALTADDWRELAAPRAPITGCGDVHEIGTALSLEDELKEIELRRGVSWDQTRHRIFWGNATNNPSGRPAVGHDFYGFGGFLEYAHHWVVNELQIPAHL
jgi:hypothetical protein